MRSNAYFAVILGLIVGGLIIMNIDTDMINQHIERFIVGEIDEQDVHDQFDYFNSKYRKSYNNIDDHQKRYAIFKDNYIFITNHNNFKAEILGYTLKVNKFADLTNQEFKDTYLGLNKSEFGNFVSEAESQVPIKEFLKKSATDEAIENLQIPSKVDWKAKGATTDVKNQGPCGSCWAFSAIAAIEGANYIARKRNEHLSEQQMVDCVHNKTNPDWYSDGCKGGIMHHVFEYAQNYSICTTADYPYTGRKESCSDSKCKT
jgi:C1A family cysteine protease